MNRKIIVSAFSVLMTVSILPFRVMAEVFNEEPVFYTIMKKAQLNIDGLIESEMEVRKETNALYKTYGDLTYEISDGEVTIKKCDKTATSIVIPDEIEGYPVKEIGYEAFYSCSNLTDIIIPNSVISIDARAFMDCSSLSSIIIPNGVTSISNATFANCISLTSITIPDSVTSIGESAFNGCSSLINIKIPEGVTSIGNRALMGCSSITSITIPDGITTIETSTFSNCSSLTSISIPDSVTSIMAYAFCGSGLSGELFIPKSVGYIETNAFKRCDNLQTITVDTQNKAYKSEDGVLYSSDLYNLVYCPTGKSGSLLIPDGVKWIDNFACVECFMLERIQIPDTVHYIGDWAFHGCQKIKEIVIPDSVIDLGRNAFSGLYEAESIKISNNIEYISEGCFSDGWKIKEIEIPHDVQTIGRDAFSCCYDLDRIVLPQSIIEIEDNAFIQSNSLNLVQYSGTEMQWDNIVFGSENDNLVRSKIVFTDGERERSKPQWDFIDGVLTISGTGDMINYWFFGLDGTTAPWNFRYKNEIKEVVVESGVTSIGECSFAYLPALEHITIGEDVTRIGGNGIAKCDELRKVIIPEGVNEIDFFAFSSDINLETIVLPSSINKIGDRAFVYCFELKNTLYLGTEEQWNTIELGEYVLDWVINSLKLSDKFILPEEISLNYSEVDLIVGEALQLEELILPANAEQDIVWMSNNSKIARISQDGLVTAVGSGTAFIKAKTINGISSTCIVNAIDSNHIHEYGKPVYTWAEDFSTVTAKAVCTECGDVVIETVSTSYEVIKEATSEEEGTGRYTALFSNNQFETQIKDVEIPATGGAYSVEVYGSSLALEGKIGINFYLNIAEEDINDLTIVMRMDEKEDTRVPASEGKASTVSGQKLRMFAYPVAVKEMRDKVTLTVEDAEGNPVKLIKGEDDYTEGYPFSATDYFARAEEVGKEKTKKLSRVLNNYGKYAQIYFDYHVTDEVLNTTDVSQVTKETLAPYQAVQTSTEVAGLTYVGGSTMLDGMIGYRLYFKVETGYQIESYTFTIDGEKVTPVKSGSQYFIEKTDIAARDLGDKNTIEVTDGKTTFGIQYCALSYAYRALELTGEDRIPLQNMCRAMYLYNQQAIEYFGS